MGSVRGDSAMESLLANTNLSQEDIKNMGRGFLKRVYAIRRQMRKWNEQGYSFRKVTDWNTEEHKKDSKIPRRQVKAFWREVGSLKRIVLLAEFCKANGLDFQTEFEKHKIDVHREGILTELLGKYEKVGITYDILKPFLDSAKMKVEKLSPALLDRVSLTLRPEDLKVRIRSAWLNDHPNDWKQQPFRVWDGKNADTSKMAITWVKPLEALEYVAENPKGIGPGMKRERQEYLKVCLAVRRRMAAESLIELRRNFRLLELRTQVMCAKREMKMLGATPR